MADSFNPGGDYTPASDGIKSLTKDIGFRETQKKEKEKRALLNELSKKPLPVTMPDERNRVVPWPRNGSYQGGLGSATIGTNGEKVLRPAGTNEPGISQYTPIISRSKDFSKMESLYAEYFKRDIESERRRDAKRVDILRAFNAARGSRPMLDGSGNEKVDHFFIKDFEQNKSAWAQISARYVRLKGKHVAVNGGHIVYRDSPGYINIEETNKLKQFGKELGTMAADYAQQQVTSWAKANVLTNLQSIENQLKDSVAGLADYAVGQILDNSFIKSTIRKAKNLYNDINNGIADATKGAMDWIKNTIFNDKKMYNAEMLASNFGKVDEYKRAHTFLKKEPENVYGMERGTPRTFGEEFTHGGTDYSEWLKYNQNADNKPLKDTIFLESTSDNEYIKNAISAILDDSKKYAWYSGKLDDSLNALVKVARSLPFPKSSGITSDVRDVTSEGKEKYTALGRGDENTLVIPGANEKYWGDGYLTPSDENSLQRVYSLADMISMSADGSLKESVFKKAGDFLVSEQIKQELKSFSYESSDNDNAMIKEAMEATAKWGHSSAIASALIKIASEENYSANARAKLINFVSDYFANPLQDLDGFKNLDNNVVRVLETIKRYAFNSREEANQWWNDKIKNEIICVLEGLNKVSADVTKQKALDDLLIRRLEELQRTPKDQIAAKYAELNNYPETLNKLYTYERDKAKELFDLSIDNLPRTLMMLTMLSDDELKSFELNFPSALNVMNKLSYKSTARTASDFKEDVDIKNYADTLDSIIRMENAEMKMYYENLRKMTEVSWLIGDLTSKTKVKPVTAPNFAEGNDSSSEIIPEFNSIANTKYKVSAPKISTDFTDKEDTSAPYSAYAPAISGDGAVLSSEYTGEDESLLCIALMDAQAMSSKISDAIRNMSLPNLMNINTENFKDTYKAYIESQEATEVEVMAIMDSTRNSYNALAKAAAIFGKTTFGQQTMETINKYTPSNWLNSQMYSLNWKDLLKTEQAIAGAIVTINGAGTWVEYAYQQFGGIHSNVAAKRDAKGNLIGAVTELFEDEDMAALLSLGSSISLNDFTGVFEQQYYKQIIRTLGLDEISDRSYDEAEKDTSFIGVRPLWSSLRDAFISGTSTSGTSDFGVGALASNFRANKVIMTGEVDYFTNGYFHLFFVKPDLNLSQDNVSQMGMIMNPMMGEIIQDLNYNTYQVSSLWQPGAFPPCHIDRSFANPYFSYILSNFAKSCSIPDLTLETKEGYENFFGGRTNFGTTTRKSGVGSDFSINFNDTSNLYIMNMIQAWVKYIEIMKEGQGSCLRKEWTNGCLDYLGALYYFVMEPDDYTISHWGRYTGIYPTSVPWSSVQLNNSIEVPEFTVPFKCQYHEWNDINILRDFNFLMRGANMNAATDYLSLSQIKEIKKPYWNTDPALWSPVTNENRALVYYKDFANNEAPFKKNPMNPTYEYRFVLEFFTPMAEDARKEIAINEIKMGNFDTGTSSMNLSEQKG